MEVHPQLDKGESQYTVNRTILLQVTLGKDLHLGPWQTKAVYVDVSSSQDMIPICLVSPSECTMAQFGCDFTEQLWQQGEAKPLINVTNWNINTVAISKGGYY